MEIRASITIVRSDRNEVFLYPAIFFFRSISHTFVISDYPVYETGPFFANPGYAAALQPLDHTRIRCSQSGRLIIFCTVHPASFL